MSVIFTKKISAIFFLILKNYWKLNFFSSIWVSIWVSIWISNMIRIETAILSLNEVSMDFKLENRKSGQISLLYIPFWAKSRMVHFDPSISSFWRGGKFAGALPSPCWTWRGKIFGKMFALIFPNARVIFWSLMKIVRENPIVAVIWEFMLN